MPEPTLIHRQRELLRTCRQANAYCDQAQAYQKVANVGRFALATHLWYNVTDNRLITKLR